MTINILFFASLREQLGSGEAQLPFKPDLTVEDVWNMSTNQCALPSNLLVAVNQEYVSFNQVIEDGDEVAFFPPVTGG